MRTGCWRSVSSSSMDKVDSGTAPCSNWEALSSKRSDPSGNGRVIAEHTGRLEYVHVTFVTSKLHNFEHITSWINFYFWSPQFTFPASDIKFGKISNWFLSVGTSFLIGHGRKFFTNTGISRWCQIFVYFFEMSPRNETLLFLKTEYFWSQNSLISKANYYKIPMKKVNAGALLCP